MNVKVHTIGEKDEINFHVDKWINSKQLMKNDEWISTKKEKSEKYPVSELSWEEKKSMFSLSFQVFKTLTVAKNSKNDNPISRISQQSDKKSENISVESE